MNFISRFKNNVKVETISYKSEFYNIPCNNHNLSYIGQSKRPLIKRRSDHKKYVRKQELFKSFVTRH